MKTNLIGQNYNSKFKYKKNYVFLCENLLIIKLFKLSSRVGSESSPFGPDTTKRSGLDRIRIRSSVKSMMLTPLKFSCLMT